MIRIYPVFNFMERTVASTFKLPPGDSGYWVYEAIYIFQEFTEITYKTCKQIIKRLPENGPYEDSLCRTDQDIL